MKNVMARAWEIYRALVGDHFAKLSAALKKAWAEYRSAKAEANKAAFSGEEMMDGYRFKLWEKYGKKRIYVENFTGSNKKNKGGYIDMISGSVFASGCVKFAIQKFMRTYAVEIG